MSHLEGARGRRDEVAIDPGIEVLGVIVLVVTSPFLFVVVPAIVHHDPFVLAHAARHRVDCGDCSTGFLKGMSLFLELIWLFCFYIGVGCFTIRQFFSERGVRYRRIVRRRRLPVEQMTSIRLSAAPRRAVDTLRWETGVDISGALPQPRSIPTDRAGFEPLMIRGTVGRFALTRMNLRIGFQGAGGRTEEVMRMIDHWVARRPELLDETARAYFVERGALPRPEPADGSRPAET